MLSILYEDTVIELEFKIDSMPEDQGDDEGIPLASIYRTILKSIHQADREELRQGFRRFAIESESFAG